MGMGFGLKDWNLGFRERGLGALKNKKGASRIFALTGYGSYEEQAPSFCAFRITSERSRDMRLCSRLQL